MTVARIQFSATAPRFPGLSLPMPTRPTTADMAHACRYFRCNSQVLATMLDEANPETFNDAASAQFLIFMALNRSRRPVTFAEAGELWLAGADYEFIAEPGDEPAAGIESEDPPPAPSDSASGEDGAAATGRHSLTA